MPLVRSKFPKASAAELAKLKALVKGVDKLEKVEKSKEAPHYTAGSTQQTAVQAVDKPAKKIATRGLEKLFDGGIANVEVTRAPLQIDNPVRLLLLLMPEITPYRWQFEELMRLGGYLETGNYADRFIPDPDNAIKTAYAAANGSGKDMLIIAGFAVWFALTGIRNRVIITSSSFEQLKFQTEVHIRELANRANTKFGQIFNYTQFHYICPELGSEIKLFATDEAKRAEGYHPYPGGKMALILNEAKSITPDIFDAIDRCTGFSYRIEISSPGQRSGEFYNHATSDKRIAYPDKLVPNKYYYRKIIAHECPCIPKAHIEDMIERRGINDPLVRSSLFAEFSDYDQPIVIPEFAFDKCQKTDVPWTGDDIGIGVDFAGGGDENTGWVRRGNKIIHKFFFTLSDTAAAVRLIDKELSPWKDTKYTFNADNGGIGQAFIDQLRDLGWQVLRRNNQSQSFIPKEFLNLGAEMWFYTKRLIEKCQIILPKDVDKFKTQMTTRYYKGFDTTQGKLALESKAEARANGHHSPDRADGFVLCFFSYRPRKLQETVKVKDGSNPVTSEELEKLWLQGKLHRYNPNTPRVGRYTLLNGKI